jgi:dTDP-glucose 4,6-dehydratase
MKTCLVAGGAGFIGSHVCDRLAQDEYRVVCVDNLITGDRENIRQLETSQNFEFIEADVTKEKVYSSQLSGYSFDYIFHLASPASPNPNSPRSYMALPVETMLVNSLGTKLLLDLAKEQGARFLFASTSEVYGDPQEHPQKEVYWGHVNPNGLRSCYDESKRFGEAMTMAYQRRWGLDTRIARIFNTYGPRMQIDDGRVVVGFIVAALKQEPFKIHGDGEQTRSFCYVSDMVEGLVKLMFTDKLTGEVVNLGNADERSVNELMEVLAEKFKVEKQVKRLPLPEDDPVRRQPDITKARELLSWEPKVDLNEGLDKTIEYFRGVTK